MNGEALAHQEFNKSSSVVCATGWRRRKSKEGPASTPPLEINTTNIINKINNNNNNLNNTT